MSYALPGVRVMKRIVLACLLACAAGCSSNDTWMRDGATGLRLAGHSACVMAPAPGGYDGIEFPKSGDQVTDAIVDALRPHLQRILIGAGPESVDQAMHNARVAEIT